MILLKAVQSAETTQKERRKTQLIYRKSTVSILATHCTILYDLTVLLCVFTAQKNGANPLTVLWPVCTTPVPSFIGHRGSAYTAVSAAPHAIKGDQPKHIHTTMSTVMGGITTYAVYVGHGGAPVRSESGNGQGKITLP